MAFKMNQIAILGATAAPLTSASTLKCTRVILQAHRDNSGPIYFGDDQVDLANKWGYELIAPVDANTPLDSKELVGLGGNVIDLATLYAVGTEDDLLNILYEEY
jgi:hypothetical protein